MNRPLKELPIDNNHKEKLAGSGYETVRDLKHVRAAQLAKDLHVTLSEAVDILKKVREPPDDPSGHTHSVSSLLREEEERRHIVTFSAAIDGLLGGGIATGTLTELCGPPGIGKTQMCMQLSVDGTIPAAYGGCEGHVIYIDTEGSFAIERLKQMATSAVKHVQSLAGESDDQSLKSEADQYTLEKILKMIIYYRCHSYLQLIALSNILHKTISQHKICLIVVDGIAAPFRYGFKDINLRHRLLSGLAQNFVKLASRFKLGVVFTNHMTTSSHASMDGSSHLVPALGESWAHVCTTRVVLYWDGLDRKAYLYKSPSLSEGAVVFKITKDGIRDDGGEASIGRIELEKEMLTRADDTVPTIKRARYSECH